MQASLLIRAEAGINAPAGLLVAAGTDVNAKNNTKSRLGGRKGHGIQCQRQKGARFLIILIFLYIREDLKMLPRKVSVKRVEKGHVVPDDRP